jgi:hypothetical protein
MPASRFGFRHIDAHPLSQQTPPQACLATGAGTVTERELAGASCRTAALVDGRRSVYVAARVLTQLGILAMAIMSASPVLSPLVLRLGSGNSAYWVQIPALMLLSCLTVASYVLTGLLHHPQPAGNSSTTALRATKNAP